MKLLHSIAGNSRTRVLLAVVDGAETVREVAVAAGVALPTAHAHLVRLRNAGLVAWESQSQGTLRALVTRVEVER